MGLTRKEIQKDRIRSTLADVYYWGLTYQSTIIGALLAVILVVLGFYGFSLYRDSQESQAQTALSAALATYNAPIQSTDSDPQTNQLPAPPNSYPSLEERNAKALEAFQRIESEFAGSQAASWAGLYSGIIRISGDESQQEDARLGLHDLTLNSPIDEVRNLASARLAQLAKRSGNTEDEILHLKAILDKPAENYPLDAVILRLAECYERAGNVEAALEQYRRLQSEFPTSQLARRANTKIDLLTPPVVSEAENEAPPNSQP